MSSGACLTNGPFHYWLRVCAHLLLLAPCGCTSISEYIHNGFKVGPNYAPAPAPLANNWIDSKDLFNADDRRPPHDSDHLIDWWRQFNDPALNDLIDTAAQQNLTLREAGFRILQARALRGIAASTLFPQSQFAQGSYNRIATSNETARDVSFDRLRFFDQWNLGFSLAWEVDFWGRFRRAIESADANLDASIDDYNDVMVTLLSDVAANYVQLRTLQKRIEYAHLNVEIQRRTRDKARDRLNIDKNGALALNQAESLLKQTDASISELEISARLTNNRLCILLGIPPEDLQRKLNPSEPLHVLLGIPAGLLVHVPSVPDDVTAGIPADLLRRRPDVRRAERQAAAQSALIGVAVSEFYPHIFLSGNLTYSADTFKKMFQPSALAGNVGPSIQWNILQYGRLVNNVRFQDAKFNELITAYQNRVLNAQQEVENGIVIYLKSRQRYQLQNESVEAAKKAERIASTVWAVSGVDFTTVSLIQQNLVQQQDTLAQTQGEQALGLIQLYKALGGGWEPDGAAAHGAPGAAHLHRRRTDRAHPSAILGAPLPPPEVPGP